MKIGRTCINWLAVAMLIVLSTAVANATEGVVVGDAYVNSAHPTTNYGGLSNLYVNSTGTTLIQFDLSSLPSGTTASQIAAASVKLYVNRINTSGLVNIAPVTSAWNESSVTSSSGTTFGATTASFTPATAQQFIVVDITSLVRDWLSGTSNNGIALSTSAGDVVFDSKENDETSHAAHLDITVSDGVQSFTVGTPTTSGSTGTVSNTGTAANPILSINFPASSGGVVQGITTSVNNTASSGNGTLSVGGTTANPVLDINFPTSAGVVQGITTSVSNTASSGAGTLSVGGTAANPVLDINFPVSSGGGTGFSWSTGGANSSDNGPDIVNPLVFTNNVLPTSTNGPTAGYAIVPTACTVKSLFVGGIYVTLAGFSGDNTIDVTVVHNGANTSMTCSVTVADGQAGTASKCLTTSGSFAVAQGDTLAYSITQSNEGIFIGNTCQVESGSNCSGPFDQISTTLVCQ